MLLFERDCEWDGGRRSRGLRRFEAVVEGMESRRLLDGSGATIVLVGSTLEVLGTNYGDTGLVTSQNGVVDVKVSNTQGKDDIKFNASQVGAVEFVGGSGSNTFTNATSLTGYLYGGSGNNVLNGGSGVDYLIAESGGTNVLNAGSGFEILEALGNGNNTLNGGSGFDVMIAYAGTNHFVGGSGYSTMLAVGGQNTIDGGSGTAVVYSFSSTDVIHSNPGITVIHVGY